MQGMYMRDGEGDAYDNLSGVDFAHPETIVSALGVDPGMVVIDFGAGSGAFTHAISVALGESGRVYAIDIQRDLLRRIANEAKRRNQRNIDVIWADLEEEGASKLQDEYVDLILVANLLFQVLDKDVLLREARRIARPRARLAVIDWSDSFGGIGPLDEHVLALDDARSLAVNAGFQYLREFPVGAYHYGLLFRVPNDAGAV